MQSWINFVSKSDSFSESNFVSGLLAVGGLILFFVYQRKNSKKWAWLKDFPCPPRPLPLVGHFYKFAGSPTNVQTYFREWVKEHGRVFYVWGFQIPMIVVTDVKIIRKVLSSSTHLEKHSNYKQVADVLGPNTLIASPAIQWVQDRKVLGQAFKQKSYFDEALRLSNIGSKATVDLLRQSVNQNQTVDHHSLFMHGFLKIAAELIMNTQLSTEAVTDMVKLISRATEAVRVRVYQPWMTFPIFYWLFGHKKTEDDLQKTGNVLMDKLRIQREEEKKVLSAATTDDSIQKGQSRRYFFDILFDLKQPRSWRKDHINFTVGAATDTVALSVGSTLFFLALHPDCQKKAIKEVHSILTSDKDEVTQEDLVNMKYVEMCWKEALRLHPPGPALGRKLAEDIVLDDGRTIKKGVDLVIMIADVHRDPEYFPNPEEFIPERFGSENLYKMDPYSYIPFSMGPRNCIGFKQATIESKVMLAHILKEFWVTTSQRAENIKHAYEIVAVPHPKISLQFSKTLP